MPSSGAAIKNQGRILPSLNLLFSMMEAKTTSLTPSKIRVMSIMVPAKAVDRPTLSV